MGGAIGFVVREENGTEHRMCRHTNNFPWYTDNIGLAEKDPGHLQKWLDGWETLKGWYKNERGQTKADWLVPYAGLNPVEYGLIVVDYKTNTILDMNNYHQVGNLSMVCLANDIEITKVTDKKTKQEGFSIQMHPDGEAHTLHQFVEAGRVPKMWWYEPKARGKKAPLVRKEMDMKGRPAMEFFTLIHEYKKDRSDKKRYYNFELDLSPFTVESFEKDGEGVRKLKQRVLDLGFKLTKKEEKVWAKYTKDRDEVDGRRAKAKAEDEKKA